jgi:hypothetical protein
MTRLIDMIAGGGWLMLALIAVRYFGARRAAKARDRAIDAAIAKNRAAQGKPPMNRLQRRATAAHQRKAKKR